MKILGFKNNKITFYTFRRKKLCYLVTNNDKTVKSLLFILSFICILSIGYTLLSTDKIPLIELFGNNSAETLLKDRISTSRSFSGNEYIKNLIALTLTPLLSYLWFGYYKLTHQKTDRILYIMMTIASCIILTYDLSKSPIIEYFISFLLLNIILGKEFNSIRIAKYFLFSIGLLLLAYSLTQDNFSFENIYNYNAGPIGRIILSQAAGLYLSLDIFPHFHPHLYFSTISGFLADILGIEHNARAARIIMNTLYPQAVLEGTAGVINSIYISEAWANFGIIGILISPIIVGVTIQILYQFLITGRKHPLKIAIYAYFSTKLPITGGFNDFLYNIPLLFTIIILSIVYSTSLMYKQSKR